MTSAIGILEIMRPTARDSVFGLPLLLMARMNKIRRS
jgi:hypothetical protein